MAEGRLGEIRLSFWLSFCAMSTLGGVEELTSPWAGGVGLPEQAGASWAAEGLCAFVLS